MKPGTQTVEAISKSMSSSVEAGDLDALRRHFAPNAILWHNTDNKKKSLDEGLAFFAGLIQFSARRWFEEVRLTPTQAGFYEQHVICFVTPEGKELRVPACMVVTLEDGLITRLEEYYDATPITARNGLEDSRRDAMKALVRGHFEEMINKRRSDLAPHYFHPRFKIERMGIQKAAEFLVNRENARSGGDADSSAAFKRMNQELGAAFPDLRLEVVGPQIADGNLVVSRLTFNGTHSGDFLGAKPTHRKVVIDEILIMRIEGDKIIEVFALGDEISFLQQLGVLPA